MAIFWLFIYSSNSLPEEIEKEFPFFPTLHHIFASRPNVTPIVITTALGPQGPKTVWYQPPDDNSNIDPQLLDTGVHAVVQTPQRERSFGDDVSGLVNADPNPAPHAVNVGDTVNVMKQNIPAKTPGPQRSPKLSSASRSAMENARQAVSKLPQKRSLADTLMEIQRYFILTQTSSPLIFFFTVKTLRPRNLKVKAASTLSCVSRLLMR